MADFIFPKNCQPNHAIVPAMNPANTSGNMVWRSDPSSSFANFFPQREQQQSDVDERGENIGDAGTAFAHGFDEQAGNGEIDHETHDADFHRCPGVTERIKRRGAQNVDGGKRDQSWRETFKREGTTRAVENGR